MKDIKKIIPVVGIAVFCLLIILLIVSGYGGLNLNLLFIFIDLPSIAIVIVGGSALAFAKMPKNRNDFLKYFSETSIVSGGVASIIGVLIVFGDMDDPSIVMYNLQMAFLAIFYGLIFSGISYALHRDKTDKSDDSAK